MKMRLNSRKKNKGKIWKTIFFILVFYLFFHFWWNDIQYQFLKIRENLNLYFSNKTEIIEKNKKLEKENQELKTKNIFSNHLYQRNQELKKKLSFLKENKLNRKIFKIIGNNSSKYWNYLIAKNELNSQIKNGQIVYFFDNFALGKVKNFDQSIIKIKAFSNYGTKENYLIITNGEVVYQGEGIGDSQNIIKMELPREIKLNKDSVILLNDNKSIIGIYDKEIFQEQDTKRKVYFKLPFNLENLIEVEI